MIWAIMDSEPSSINCSDDSSKPRGRLGIMEGLRYQLGWSACVTFIKERHLRGKAGDDGRASKAHSGSRKTNSPSFVDLTHELVTFIDVHR